jgi:hypothetical protein
MDHTARIFTSAISLPRDFVSCQGICQGEFVNEAVDDKGNSGGPNSSGSVHDSNLDPVRRRRHVIARWTQRANRLGSSLYGIAIAVFIVGFLSAWNEGFTVAITVCLVLGSLLLAPAIVLGYAIKATEREENDLERRRHNSGPR